MASRLTSMLLETTAVQRLRGHATAWLLYVVAAVIGLVAAIFALIALVIWLTQHVPPVTATLTVAAGLIIIAGVIALAGRARVQQVPQKPVQQQDPMHTPAMTAATSALMFAGRRMGLGFLDTRLGTNPYALVFAALWVGASLGRRLRSPRRDAFRR